MMPKLTQVRSLVPVVVSNPYSLYGIWFLNWSVADLFFWFWCEFALAGITTFALTRFWVRAHPDCGERFARQSRFEFAFGFCFSLLYGSLFTSLAYVGEWKSWDRFPVFIAGKWTGLSGLVVAWVLSFGIALAKRDFLKGEYRSVELDFGRRAWVVLGLYAVLMFHYHFTGAKSLNLSHAYLQTMAATLITLKMAAEAGLFDRFFKRRPRKA